MEGDVSTLQQTATDLTTAVRNAEGDISTLQQTAGQLTILVSNKYDKVSGIDIVADGVEISGSKYVKIKSGGSFEVESGKFNIDTQGNATFGGSLDGANGTFAGTVAANGVIACNIDAGKITSGTLDCGNLTVSNLSASDVHGGTIDATDVTITNLNAGSIVGGTIDARTVTLTNLNATEIKSGTLDCGNLTVSNLTASDISGGTLVLGGYGNGKGLLQIVDENNVLIGSWSKDGIRADVGTFSGEIAAGAVVSCNISADKIDSGHMLADRIEGGTLTLGRHNNTDGELIIKDANGVQIGSWGKNGINADVGTFSGTLNAVSGTFSNLDAGQWRFDNGGAHVSVGNYNMGVGDANSAGYTDGGIYFNIKNDPTPSTGTALQSEIRMLAKAPSSTFATEVVLECRKDSSANYSGAFYQVAATGAGGVSLGTIDYAWYTAWMTNICATGQLRLYPKMTAPPSSGLTEAYGSLVIESVTSGNRKSIMLIPGGGTNYEYQIGKSDYPMEWGFFAYLGDSSHRVSQGYFENITSRNQVNVDSSIAYKHDVKDIGECGEKIDRLRPVSYIHNDDKKNRKQFGLIWEEAVEVIPEICTQDGDHKGIAYAELIPVLLKEIQSLRKRVQDLEERCIQCTM